MWKHASPDTRLQAEVRLFFRERGHLARSLRAAGTAALPGCGQSNLPPSFLAFEPFALSNIKLAGYGVSRYAKERAIEELEAAGLITVDQKPGCAPKVRWVGPAKTFDR